MNQVRLLRFLLMIAGFLCFGSISISRADSRYPTAVDWHPVTNQIAVGYGNGDIIIYNGATRDLLRALHVPGYVQTLRWNPADNRLAGVSNNYAEMENVIWTLDTTTEVLIEGLRGDFAVGDLDWNPDGTLLVSTDFIGMGSQTLTHLWQASPGELHTFKALENYEFNSADWHPTNNTWIALAEDRGLWAVWDVENNVLIDSATAGSIDDDNLLQAVSWDTTGSKIATLDFEGNVEIWDWDNQQLTFQSFFQGTPQTIGATDMLWSPDGDKLALLLGTAVRIINAGSGREVATTPVTAFLNAAAWSPDGTQLVYAGRGPELDSGFWEIYDLPLMSLPAESEGEAMMAQPGATLDPTSTHPTLIQSVDWSVDDRQIAIGRQDGTLEILDSSSGQVILRGQYNDDIAEVEWNPVNNQILAVAANVSWPESEDDTIYILNTDTTLQTVATLDGGRQINSIEWSADGTELAAAVSVSQEIAPGNEYTEVRIWNISTQDMVSLTYLPLTGTIDWLETTSRIAALTVDDVFIWDRSTDDFTTVYEPTEFEFLWSIAWSPDGKFIALSKFVGVGVTLEIRNVISNEVSGLVSVANASYIAWSPDGRLAALLTAMQQIKIFDGKTGSEIQSINVGRANTFAWNSAGDQIAHDNAESGEVEIVAAPPI